MWGDPHVLTCDGFGYDCNAQGVFTLMYNMVWNIQARLTNVYSAEMKKVIGWNNYPTASWAVDMAIQNKEDDEFPLMQFSFEEDHDKDAFSAEGSIANTHWNPNHKLRWCEGDCDSDNDCLDGLKCFRRDRRGKDADVPGCTGRPLTDMDYCIKDPDQQNSDDNVGEYTGCMYNIEYDSYIYVNGRKYHDVDSVEGCRKMCENHSECDKFTYHVTNKCKMATADAKFKDVDKGCSDLYSGDVDKCGWYEEKYKSQNGKQNQGTLTMNKGCQLSYFQDGDSKNIEDMEDGDYFWRSDDGDSYAQLGDHKDKIYIVYKMKSGHNSQITLDRTGGGPGRDWGCHWNIYTCLPMDDEDDKEGFETSIGLLGSPDKDKSNDWMTPEGDIVDIPTHWEDGGWHATRGQAAYDYCTEK